MVEIKEGDIVKIGKLDKDNYNEPVEDLKGYKGRIVSIRRVFKADASCKYDRYKVDVDYENYIWSGDMFDLHIPNPQEMDKLERRKLNDKTMKYIIYYKKRATTLTFIYSTTGEWLFNTSIVPMPRKLILKIEAILRGLNSNG